MYLNNDTTKSYYCHRFELAYIKEFKDKLEELISD